MTPFPCAALAASVFAAAFAACGPAQAEPLPAGDRERACWLQHTRDRTRARLVEPVTVDFANLRDGYTVRSPFLIDFSVRGMGVIAAGKPHPKAGHHHLLVDTPLPPNPVDAIPFNERHRHFGAGQTGTEVQLPPGPHTLRLLFADDKHRPYFVFSPEIRVNVSGPRSATPVALGAGCDAWYQEEVSRPRPPGARVVISNLRDGEAVVSPFTVRLAADGFNIAPRGSGVAGSGHFGLEVLQAGRLVRSFDLAGGATQAVADLPVGNYGLRLHLYDDARSRELVPAAELTVSVTAQER